MRTMLTATTRSVSGMLGRLANDLAANESSLWKLRKPSQPRQRTRG
jgi:hypothetical protein